MGSKDYSKEYESDKDRVVSYDTKTSSYVNGRGEALKFTNDYNSMSIYSKTPDQPHSGVHVNIDRDNDTFTVTTHDESGNSETNTGHCYLTSACLQHFQNEFDDNCEELTILRWFRDNYVTKDDIKHYYETAPIIVEAINKIDKCEKIYEYIYEHVVLACVEAIKNGDYNFAYDRYKTSIQTFEEQFARPYLETKLVSVLAN